MRETAAEKERGAEQDKEDVSTESDSETKKARGLRPQQTQPQPDRDAPSPLSLLKIDIENPGLLSDAAELELAEEESPESAPPRQQDYV